MNMSMFGKRSQSSFSQHQSQGHVPKGLNKKQSHGGRRYRQQGDLTHGANLSSEEQTELNIRFPEKAELSYGKRLSKKVPADAFAIMPMGQPCMLWFTYDKYRHGDTVFVVTQNGETKQFSTKVCCFDKTLAYGTVLSGVLHTINNNQNRKQNQNRTSGGVCSGDFNHQTSEVFCADSISYYKGDFVGFLSTSKKLDLLCDIFSQDLIRNLNLPGTISVVMPVLTQSLLDAESLSTSLPYKTYALRFLDMQARFPIGDLLNGLSGISENPSRVVLDVKAEIAPDIYSLYGYRQGVEGIRYVGRAQIPSYDCSKMMNGLFRRVRENVNIDLIEESEDEDDFQDIKEDKFVDTSKTVRMVFDYSAKSRKYIPIGLADESGSCTLSVIPMSDTHNRSNNHHHSHKYPKTTTSGYHQKPRPQNVTSTNSKQLSKYVNKQQLQNDRNMIIPMDMIEQYRRSSHLDLTIH